MTVFWITGFYIQPTSITMLGAMYYNFQYASFFKRRMKITHAFIGFYSALHWVNNIYFNAHGARHIAFHLLFFYRIHTAPISVFVAVAVLRKLLTGKKLVMDKVCIFK